MRKGGLRGRLLASFLSLSLIPLCLLGALGYLTNRVNVLRDINEQLQIIAEEKQNSMYTRLSEFLRDLNMLIESEGTVLLMKNLTEAIRENKLQTASFVGSYEWEKLLHKHVDDLRAFRRNYGYHDILLLDLDGNVLYSIGREYGLGLNVMQADYGKTPLREAFKRTLASGESTISDIHRDVHSSGILTGYVTGMVLDATGDPVGIVAVQFPLIGFDKMIKTNPRLGKKGEVYLINSKRVMVSHSSRKLSEQPELIPVDSEGTKFWVDEHFEAGSKDVHETLQSYRSYRGEDVFGAHRTLRVGGLVLGVIAEMDASEAMRPVRLLGGQIAGTITLAILIVAIVAIFLARGISNPLRCAASFAKRIGMGDLSGRLEVDARGEIEELASALNNMTAELRERRTADQQRRRIDQQLGQLRDQMIHSKSLSEMLETTLAQLSQDCGATAGALYLQTGQGGLRLGANFATEGSVQAKDFIPEGTGLIGQVAKNGKSMIVSKSACAPRLVTSGLADVEVEEIRCEPVEVDGRLVAVLELLFVVPPIDTDLKLLRDFLPVLASGILIEQANMQTRELLEETCMQSEQLQKQQEDLQAANEELKENSEELLSQQEDLSASNTQLEEQHEQLEAERTLLRERNLELQRIRDQLEDKAQQLEESTRYKSEFLANMSHELRTPLNSILLLSRNLASNPDTNLSEDEVRAADIIARSGEGLLNMINQILDLSKIEARQVNIRAKSFSLKELKRNITDMFTDLAHSQGLTYEVTLAEDLPDKFLSDQIKIEQVLRNLISNAFKFTETGGIYVSFKARKRNEEGRAEIRFSVRDTGIGIPEDMKQKIFYAFQQVESGLTKNYSGTGLGLSISRNFVDLLGGHMAVESTIDEGSTFYFDLPELSEEGVFTQNDLDENIIGGPRIIGHQSQSQSKAPQPPEQPHPNRPFSGYEEPCEDDRDQIAPGDSVVLIVEDDALFASILRDSCREYGIRCLLAGTGEAGLELAQEQKPNAILLDMILPGISGETVLKRLKDSVDLRHIPVHILTGSNMLRQLESRGVLGVLKKPISKEDIHALLKRLEVFWQQKQKNLLIIAHDAVYRQRIRNIVGDQDVLSTEASSGQEAIELLRSKRFDCIVLDLELQDMGGVQFLRSMHDKLEHIPPVIVYNGSSYNQKELGMIEALSDSIIISDVKSEDRLIDETALFMHRVVADLPAQKKQVISSLYDPDQLLRGKSVLLVDDDMRNLFSLGKALRQHGMKVTQAEDGETALQKTVDERFDIILIDLMMPKMHGFETIQKIREQEAAAERALTPVIVVTAKTMPGDRRECLKVGANDYLAKPVDLERLCALMRIWLY